MQYGGANQNDVFAMIKGLVNDMIAKLEKEAAEGRLPRQILNWDLEVFRKHLRSSVSIMAVQQPYFSDSSTRLKTRRRGGAEGHWSRQEDLARDLIWSCVSVI